MGVNPQVLRFSTFALDVENAWLFRNGMRLQLSPKDCALLHHLVLNVGVIVSHQELLRVVWGETAIGPDVLKVRIARLRRLLGDDAGSPHFIANVHGEGYRFLPQPEHGSVGVSADGSGGSRQPVVGRQAEINMLREAFFKAMAGQRQIVFVTGEAGIGKTTLIDLFVARAGEEHVPLWIGRGQCIEHYGSGEPYLPVLEALGRLGRDHARGAIRAVLRQYAPSWLLQLPALLNDEERESLQRRALPPTRERMLRELAEALEALDTAPVAEGAPALILVLEDLHWADASTLDLLRMVAKRRERARLLVIGSYRELEATAASHSLRGLLQELRRERNVVSELSLGPLTEADVAQYITEQFPQRDFPTQLVSVIHQRTAGNPLFLSDIIRDLQAQGIIARDDAGWRFHGEVAGISAMMPASLRQLVATQRGGLTREQQRLLAAASIAGYEFSAAAVAAALSESVTDVEEDCLQLTEHQNFLRLAGSDDWPDGTQSMQFAFHHALHQELWQEYVSHARREEWHLRIATRKEAAYAGLAHQIAPELANHFEQGRDWWRALTYREHAGRLALQRAANTEAQFHLDRAFSVLQELPETPERLHYELRLQIQRGTLAALTAGDTSPEAKAAFERAREVCRQVGEAPELYESAFGLCRVFWFRGELETARELAEQMQSMMQGVSDPVRAMAGQVGLGSVLLSQGDLTAAIAALTTASELSRIHWNDGLLGVFASDLEVVSAGSLASALQMAGYPDQALKHQDEALRIGERRSHPIAKAASLWGAALFYQLRGEAERAQEFVDELSRVGSDHQLVEFFPFIKILGGWVRIVRGEVEQGIADVRCGAEILKGVGASLYEPYALGLLVTGHAASDDVVEARRVMDEALAAAARNGSGFYDAELHRIDGELKLQSAGPGAIHEATKAFGRAIAVAREQSAKSWELRAVLSLARLRRRQGDALGAHSLLSDTYNRFTEGFNTPDLNAARTFLSDAS